MKLTDYKEISKKMTTWTSNSIVFYILIFNLGELLPKNKVVDIIMLVIIPLSCLLFLLYKYFQMKQTSKLELLRIIGLIFMILLMLRVTIM